MNTLYMLSTILEKCWESKVNLSKVNKYSEPHFAYTDLVQKVWLHDRFQAFFSRTFCSVSAQENAQWRGILCTYLFSCNVVFGLLLYCIKLSSLKTGGFRSLWVFHWFTDTNESTFHSVLQQRGDSPPFLQVAMLKHREFSPVSECVMFVCWWSTWDLYFQSFFSSGIQSWCEIQLPKHRYLVLF